MLEVFIKHLGLTQEITEYLLLQPLSVVLELPHFQEILNNLDIKLLRQTLEEVKPVFTQHLPPFYDWLQNELGIENVPDSPKHANEWVINFLYKQERLTRLVELHRPVPLPALEKAVAPLVDIFGILTNDHVRHEWQKAVAALCLVIIIGCRETDLFSDLR